MQPSSDSIKLLQITDTHLFEADEGSLLSVRTADSFAAVVKEILHRQVPFEYILATGDISQDHSAESYQRFAEGISPLKKIVFGFRATMTTSQTWVVCYHPLKFKLLNT